MAKTLKAALQQRHLAAEEAEKKAMDAEREVGDGRGVRPGWGDGQGTRTRVDEAS